MDKPSPINPSKVTVKFRPTDGSPDIALLTNGEPEQVDEARAAEVLKLEDLDIRIDLGQGTEKAQYWTCDLSHVSHFFNIQTSLTLKLQECKSTISIDFETNNFQMLPLMESTSEAFLLPSISNTSAVIAHRFCFSSMHFDHISEKSLAIGVHMHLHSLSRY